MCDLPHLTTNCFVNGKPYVLNLTVSKMSLTLTLTNKNTFEKWRCTPSVEYVESMTRKTGNFKTYAVFSDMMRAVFLNASSSLTMKLLTQGELEKINDSSIQATFPESHGKKRIYFILVYTSEFDRIHYPLPLDYVGLPNPEILQATIHGLENDKSNLLKELEKSKMKSESNRLAEIGSLKRCLADTSKQCGELARKCQTVLDEFEKLKMRVDSDRNVLKKELLEFRQEIDQKISTVMAEVGILVNSVRNQPKSKVGLGSPRRTLNRGDAPGRLSDSSVDKSTLRRNSPRRPQSPASIYSCGSISASSIGRKIPDGTRNFRTKTSPRKFPDPVQDNCPVFSDTEVNTVRLQIEALQRAVLGLSNNLKTSNM